MFETFLVEELLATLRVALDVDDALFVVLALLARVVELVVVREPCAEPVEYRGALSLAVKPFPYEG